MNWRNCITMTKLHHPMWRNCIPGDLISSVRTFWFQHSTNYTIFNLKCISAQQIKENTFNFQLHSYVHMKYTACFADMHRKRRYDEITSPYVSYVATETMIRSHFQSPRSPDAAFGGLIGWLPCNVKFSCRLISNIRFLLEAHCRRRGWWYHVPHSSF